MGKFDYVTELKEKLDSVRPLPSEAVKNLNDIFRVEWTYHSNAIEGNTLSLAETKIVLEEGLTIGGKRMQEHLEVINHSEAIEFVYECVDQAKPLDARMIKNLHYLVLKTIDNKNAGKFREINVRISGSRHVPPHFLHVSREMAGLFDWYDENKNRLHPVELAALCHFKFVYIHPFSDGNGRTARLLMNFILIQNGYPPAVVKAEAPSRIKYYETLEKASLEQDTTPFIMLINESVEASLNVYLGAVT